MRNSQYIISPRGRGFDCHRTWEALVLGVVPIIKTSVNDTLFKEMPVLIVDSFKEINNDLLNNNKDFGSLNLDKITLEYWVDFIKHKKFTLKKKLSKGRSLNLKNNKKKYSLSTFQYLTKHLILMIISDSSIVILFFLSFFKIVFYPFLVFKDIFVYMFLALINKI